MNPVEMTALAVCFLVVWAHGILVGIAFWDTRSANRWNRFIDELRKEAENVKRAK